MKCQSNRSASEAGAAWKSGEGELASSWASRTECVSCAACGGGKGKLTNALDGGGFRVELRIRHDGGGSVLDDEELSLFVNRRVCKVFEEEESWIGGDGC